MSRTDLDWPRVAELFHAARELPPAQQDAWLERETGSNTAIRSEVRSLLAADRTHEALSAEAALAHEDPQTPPERLSERFGPYKTERLLGRGGMGTVYLAHRDDGQFDRTVALKVIGASLSGPDFLRRFRTEQQALASLNHGNITRLLDGGVSAAGDPYLVLEYVDGVPLDRYCDEGKLGIEARLMLFLAACEAVDYAHRHFILHRDLKPGNIFVNAEGTVKLLDFGTASMMADDADKTRTDARMLTPRYASPEQLQGERPAIADDVFSLGVVLYELLTGAWPFGTPGSVVSELQRITGDTGATRPSSAITERAAELRSASPDRLRRLLAGDLSAIVLKALEHDPARRFGTVRQLADDIGHFLSGQPVMARKQTATYRAGKFLRRHTLAAGAAVVFVLGISVAGIVAWRQALAARAETQKAEQVNLFLNDMLSSASRFNFDPEKYTVLQTLDAASQRLENGALRDPLTGAILHRSLASSYCALTLNDKATQHIDRALATLRAIDAEVEVADALRIKAQIAINQGQYEAAATLLEEALALTQRPGGKAPPVVVFRVKSNLARVYSFFLNRHADRARSLYTDAIGIATPALSIPRSELASTLAGWGGMLHLESRDKEAEEALLNALETGRKEDAGGYWEFGPLYELALIRNQRRDYAGAKAFARRMIDVTVRSVGPANPATAQATITWARYAAETGEMAAAVDGVLQAMPIIEKSFASPSLVLWHSARDAARVLRLAGRYSEAEQYARESLAVALAAHLSDADPRTANSWEELGKALCAQQQRSEGIHALEQAEAIYMRAGGRWLERAAETRQQIADERRHAAPAR